MKKTIHVFSVSLLAGAMALVSCTSDLKPDIERVEQQQIENDKLLWEKIEQTESSLLTALRITNIELDTAKSALVSALEGKVSITDYQAALTEYSNRLNQIISAQKVVDDEQNEALEDIYNKIADLKTYVDNQISELKNYVDGEVDKLYDAIAQKETALRDYINAEIAKLQAQIDVLKARVQSVIFVPQYTDMKFGLPFSVVKDNAPNPHYAAAAVDTVKNIVYKVSPDSLAESLAQNAKDIFGFLVKDDLKTRGTAQPELVILEAKGDNTTGEIQFTLKQQGFEPTEVRGDYDVNLDRYAVALGIVDSDRNLGITSPYTQATLAPSDLITVDIYNVYRKVKGCKDASGNIVISPNVAVDDNKGANPENLEIKYTGDVSKVPSYKTSYKPSYKAVSTFQKDTVVLYENTYLAAWVSSKFGVATGPYTYDQLDSLGFNISSYVKHSESETIETSVPDYTTDAAISGANAVVSAPVTEAFSPISLYYDAATKSSKMSTRKHLVGKCVAKTIIYKTGICDESYAKRTAKVSFIQADDIYFRFALDTLKWSYAQDAAQDNAAFKGQNPVYSRTTLNAHEVEASLDEGVSYKKFVDGADEFYGVELKDFDGLTRQSYYEESETNRTDVDSEKNLNLVLKGIASEDPAVFINTYAQYDAANKTLVFGHDATPAKKNYAFVRKAAFEIGAGSNDRTNSYGLISRATNPSIPSSINAGAYILPNNSGVQYIAAKSGLIVTTQDRKRDVIYVTGQDDNAISNYPATVTPTVKTASLNRFDVLVNGNNSFTDHGSYLLNYAHTTLDETREHYEIQSGDIKDAVYSAFIQQGIFSTGDFASSTEALNAEIVHNGNMNPGTAYNSGHNSYFELVSTPSDLALRSHGSYSGIDPVDNSASLLTSERLKNLVRIYPDYNEKPFVEDGRFIEYVFFTYTGQEVHVLWSLGSIAATSGTYEFRTKVSPAASSNREFAFKANTTGDYANPKWMYMSNIVGIYPSAGSTEIEKYDVDNEHYYFGTSVADTHLVPEFKLVHNENYTGTDMFGLNARYYILGGTSNLLKYEGTSSSVEVAGQLWMYSGTTSVRFPVTAKIKVNGTKGDSIFILRP